MATLERIKRRCAVCDVVENKPLVKLSKCQEHHELRCLSCNRDNKHAAPAPSIFSNVSNAETSIIHSILEQKEINGSKLRTVHSFERMLNLSLSRMRLKLNLNHSFEPSALSYYIIRPFFVAHSLITQ
jgi:hypothetical protein